MSVKRRIRLGNEHHAAKVTSPAHRLKFVAGRSIATASSAGVLFAVISAPSDAETTTGISLLNRLDR